MTLRTRKQYALLFLLARSSGRPISRDALTDLLWSDYDAARARHSLSHSASLMNKVLGPEAIAPAGRNRLTLREGLVRLDVAEFEEHVEEGRLEEAHALWRGGLLEGLWVPRAPGFERWLGEERDRQSRRLREVLAELVEVSRVSGDWEGMRSMAEELLEVDPLDEGAMLGYLEALSLLDQRTLALRRYGQFEKRLKEELDAEPGSALRGWVRRHRKGDAVVRAPQLFVPRVSDTMVLPAVRPLFGRDREYAELWEAWEATRNGRGSFIIVQGEAGIGKTALASKLANQVHVAGGSLCFVKCYRTERSVPFAAISALIRQLSRLPGFVATNEIWIGELTRLVPELRERFPHVPQPMAIDDSARFRLCDATLKAAEAVSEEQPLLVVVDDIQDADEATLALLHYWGRQCAATSVMLLCASRFAQDQSDFQATFYETARTANLARFQTLGALIDADIERLSLQVLAQRGVKPSEQHLRVLVGLAGGNPLRAIEAAISRPHHDAPSPGLLTVNSQKAGDDFESTATERLVLLSVDARMVAEILSIAGRPLGDYELAALTRLRPAELSGAVSELEAARFIRRGNGDWGLAHEQYAAVVEGAISSRSRKQHHVRLARLITQRADTDPAALYEAAQHLAAAGKRPEAEASARAAARHAASMGVVPSKAAALELACDVADNPRPDLLMDLGSCYLDLNDIERLDDLCTRIACGTHGRSTALAAAVRYFQVAADITTGRVNLADAQCRLTDAVASPDLEPRYRREAQLLLIRTADKTGSYALVRRTARAMRTHHSGQESLSAAALFAAGYVAGKYYSPQRALLLVEAALKRAGDSGNWSLEQQCRDALGILLKKAGKFADSVAAFDQSLALARKLINPVAEVACLNNRAVSEMVMGNYSKVAQTHQLADRLSESFPNWALHYFRRYNEAVLALYQGHPDQAQTMFERVASNCHKQGLQLLAAEATAGRGLALQRQNDAEGLARVANELTGLLRGGQAAVPTWIDRALLAYADIVNGKEPAVVLAGCARHSRLLKRHDISHWLAFELELIRIREWASGSESAAERARLTDSAREYNAGGILLALRQSA